MWSFPSEDAEIGDIKDTFATIITRFKYYWYLTTVLRVILVILGNSFTNSSISYLIKWRKTGSLEILQSFHSLLSPHLNFCVIKILRTPQISSTTLCIAATSQQHHSNITVLQRSQGISIWHQKSI